MPTWHAVQVNSASVSQNPERVEPPLRLALCHPWPDGLKPSSLFIFDLPKQSEPSSALFEMAFPSGLEGIFYTDILKSLHQHHDLLCAMSAMCALSRALMTAALNPKKCSILSRAPMGQSISSE